MTDCEKRQCSTYMISAVCAAIATLLAFANFSGCAFGSSRDVNTITESASVADQVDDSAAAESGASELSFRKIETVPQTKYDMDYSLTELPVDDVGFAFRLGAELLSEAPADENFLCAPYAAWLPLAALVNAIDYDYKNDLLESIGASGLSEEQLNEYARLSLHLLFVEVVYNNSAEYNLYPMSISNTLLVGNDAKPSHEFAQLFFDKYYGALANIDFSSAAAARELDLWTESQTQGEVDEISGLFEPEESISIANAFVYTTTLPDYLSFDSSEIQSQRFYNGTDYVSADYISRVWLGKDFYQDDRVQACRINFGHSFCSLWVILPRSGTANDLFLDITRDEFYRIRNSFFKTWGTLELPEFSITAASDLTDALSAIGVPLIKKESIPLWDYVVKGKAPINANLNGGSGNTWVSRALQSTVFSFDTIGVNDRPVSDSIKWTEPRVIDISADYPRQPWSEYLTIGIRYLSEKPTPEFEMICDRPFVFIFEAFDHILYAGVVNDPSKS